MSVQTGIEAPHGPASQRIGDRVRYRVDLWRTEPNPLWVREMRQAARLLRTPIILMVLTVLMTLLMASLGGLLTGNQSPAEAGTILFHVYFSLAFFVVTLVGPALAANSIASEREGQTWEAVLLTGMRPAEIARGKFLAAYTSIAMYVVMLAPVGAIPFLFGGVTPFEVLIAFAFLFLIALLSVAFGLAISSKMASLRGALLVTLLVAIPLSLFLFSSGGVGLSMAVHELWPAVQAGAPVWLPTAYGRAPLGVDYLVYLVLFPVTAIVLPAWLLYEITRANLTSVTDDRSHGVKRWFVVAALVQVAAAMVPVFAMSGSDRVAAAIAGMGTLWLFGIFSAFLFASEPIGPSRRVELMLADATPLRQLLAPGVVKAAQLQLGICSMAVIAVLAVALAQTSFGSPSAGMDREMLLVFAAYALGFGTFVIGLTALLRARAPSAVVPRVLLLVVIFFLCIGPWILAAISGAFSSGTSAPEVLLASPSPFYVFFALDAVSSPVRGGQVVASLAASSAYLLIGLILLAVAAGKCKEIIERHRRVLAEADERLAAEDEQAAAARLLAEEEALAALESPEQGPGEEGDVLETGSSHDESAGVAHPGRDSDDEGAEPDS